MGHDWANRQHETASSAKEKSSLRNTGLAESQKHPRHCLEHSNRSLRFCVIHKWLFSHWQGLNLKSSWFSGEQTRITTQGFHRLPEPCPCQISSQRRCTTSSTTRSGAGEQLLRVETFYTSCNHSHPPASNSPNTSRPLRWSHLCHRADVTLPQLNCTQANPQHAISDPRLRAHSQEPAIY